MHNMIDSKLYEDVASTTNVISGDEYQKLFCTVAQVVSDIVGQTLGPYGATTIIDDGGGFTYPTKDGWSCMNRLRFSDPVYNSIYSIQKQISFNSVNTVGDGTTTAQVATSYFLNEFFNNLLPILKNSGKPFSQAEFIKAMADVTDRLCIRLRTNPNVHKIDHDGDFKDIYQVAYIATNGNDKFASMIQQIYAATKNPNIRVEIDGGAPESVAVIEKGYRFDCKVISYRNYVDSTDGTIHWGGNQPFSVVILDHNVTFNMHRLFVPVISQLANKLGRKIMIMAPYFDDLMCGEIDAQVTALKRQGQDPNIMLVQIPLAAKLHQEAIQDLSILTNALICTQSRVKYVNLMIQNSRVQDPNDIIHDPIEEYEEFKKYQNSPEKALRDCLGTCAGVLFDNNNGYLQDYENYCDKKRYDERMWEVTKKYEALRAKADKTIDGTMDKDFLAVQTHYIRLTGNCGVIKVGGASDIQRRCDKDALDDATLACKSAFQYGYVRGMGLEILKICKAVGMDGDGVAESITRAIYTAFKNTIARIIANKYGVDIDALATQTGTVEIAIAKSDWSPTVAFTTTVNKLVDEIIDRAIQYDQCYDLRKDELQEPGCWTVINSVQTDIEILRAMTTIVTTIMTSSQFLSMSKAYDNNLTHAKALKGRMSDEAQIAKAKAEAVLDAVDANKEKKQREASTWHND